MPITRLSPFFALPSLALTATGFANFVFLALAGISASTSIRGHVPAQTFEGRLAHHAVGAEAGEFDLRHQVGLDPMNTFFVARRARPVKGLDLAFLFFQAGEKSRNGPAAITGAHPAHIDQMLAFMDAHQQRAEFPLRRAPTADYHFMSGPAFGFDPDYRPAPKHKARWPAWRRCLPDPSGTPIPIPCCRWR